MIQRSGDAPTEAAKAIVGEFVPLKLVADLCYGDGCVTVPLLAPEHTQTIKSMKHSSLSRWI